MIGGSFFDNVIVPNITIVNLLTRQVISHSIPDSSLIVYGATAVQYKKSIYIFGGGTANVKYINYNSASNLLWNLTFTSSDGDFMQCSAGTVGVDCSPCAQGTYFNTNNCAECPLGRYSQSLAATSVEQCVPCAADYYTNKNASIYCVNCPAGSYCPVGSVNPLKSMSSIKPSSIQPKAYNGKTAYVSDVVTNAWYVIGGISCVLIFSTILLKDFFKKLKKLDLFSSQHTQTLNKPVIFRKTKIGGIISLLFIIAAIVSILGATMSMYIDNISEIKTLIPLITLTQEIEAKNLAARVFAILKSP
jgi:hypothetical protein